jgi:hypothetical protein
MKTKILILSLLSAILFAQEITGAWSGANGSRDVASSNYSYKKDGNSLISSMDSPKQGNKYSAWCYYIY